ncbi:aldehyde dehydrogenase family protein [archaeon]|nr:MAG: aldehyde dehydrogenase family protein [archaeon]
MSELPNYINGEFVTPQGVEYINVTSPATEEVIAKVPLNTAQTVDVAVTAAKRVFPEWSALTVKQRAAIMFKFHNLVEQHSQELAELIVKENGKNIVEALADVAKGNETAEWACSLPQIVQGKILEVSKGISCQENRVPLGVVGAIVPFNFPAMVPMWTIPIALTVGNCVILKPSEKVPCTMQRMAELFQQAGVPPGVFQIVHGAVDVVNALCDHPDISAVTFVGSSKVAELVAHRCHAINKRVLALGGAKNHLLALPDCDVGMASRDIVASFAGCCGQRCMAASVLVLVEEEGEGCLDALLQQVVSVASKLEAGQRAGQVGPLIDDIAQRRVIKYIDESEAGGAKILLDGRGWAKTRPQGHWVGPTVILHHNATDRALVDEIFGPILSIIKVKTREEALQIENDNEYGNAACVYTEKGANAEWFVKRFRAAMLGVNIGIPVPRGRLWLYNTENGITYLYFYTMLMSMHVYTSIQSPSHSEVCMARRASSAATTSLVTARWSSSLTELRSPPSGLPHMLLETARLPRGRGWKIRLWTRLTLMVGCKT